MWTIIVILLILWLLGLISSYTLGGLIHILLVVALVLIVVRLLQGHKIV
ncbi:MAG: lmo0937 family membrane protein [Candidatus Moranbacteria bacterium]|nr:lmo0937 family membrane protein [Candidatus Moranbacteria bacterium]